MKMILTEIMSVVVEVLKTLLDIALFLVAVGIVVFIVSIAFVPELRDWFVEAIRAWIAS